MAQKTNLTPKFSKIFFVIYYMKAKNFEISKAWSAFGIQNFLN